MYVGIATDDVEALKERDEFDYSDDGSATIEHPVFISASVLKVQTRVESYLLALANDYGTDMSLPEYKICEVTVVGVLKGYCEFSSHYTPMNTITTR